MDRVQEFSDEQRKVLLWIKQHDPMYDLRYAMAKKGVKQIEQIAAKAFKQGTRIKLFGMKDKKWNGEKAVISGERIIKDGVFRWPVQLLNGKKGKLKSKEVPIIKQC